MGFLDFFKKKRRMYADEAAQKLLSTALSFDQEFLDNMKEILEFDSSFFEDDYLRTELCLLCVWLAVKTLSQCGDGPALTDRIGEKFMAIFHGEDRKIMELLVEERFERYEASWDENSGANQSILCTNILSCMFNMGEIDESLSKFIGVVPFLNFFILETIGAILKYRERIEIIY